MRPASARSASAGGVSSASVVLHALAGHGVLHALVQAEKPSYSPAPAPGPCLPGAGTRTSRDRDSAGAGTGDRPRCAPCACSASARRARPARPSRSAAGAGSGAHRATACVPPGRRHRRRHRRSAARCPSSCCRRGAAAFPCWWRSRRAPRRQGPAPGPLFKFESMAFSCTVIDLATFGIEIDGERLFEVDGDLCAGLDIARRRRPGRTTCSPRSAMSRTPPARIRPTASWPLMPTLPMEPSAPT